MLISAGLGQIDHSHLEKAPPELGWLVVKIGGPAYRIGMGGGAASSVASGSNKADLDFNAVQVWTVPIAVLSADCRHLCSIILNAHVGGRPSIWEHAAWSSDSGRGAAHAGRLRAGPVTITMFSIRLGRQI